MSRWERRGRVEEVEEEEEGLLSSSAPAAAAAAASGPAACFISPHWACCPLRSAPHIYF